MNAEDLNLEIKRIKKELNLEKNRIKNFEEKSLSTKYTSLQASLIELQEEQKSRGIKPTESTETLSSRSGSSPVFYKPEIAASKSSSSEHLPSFK